MCLLLCTQESVVDRIPSSTTEDNISRLCERTDPSMVKAPTQQRIHQIGADMGSDCVMSHLIAQGHHACARERGNVHDSLHLALLLSIPQGICQRQTPLRVGVVHLQAAQKPSRRRRKLGKAAVRVTRKA